MLVFFIYNESGYRKKDPIEGDESLLDVVVIGAGIVGASVARELTRYELSVLVVERATDVCEGATKANSAIVHSGFDAKPGTLKAKYNVLGNKLYDKVEQELNIKLKRNGSLNLCFEDSNREEVIDKLYAQGIANGVEGMRIIEREELLTMEPNLQDNVICALYCPTAGIVDSFEVNLAYAENAAHNGAKFKFDTKVTGFTRKEDGTWIVKTDRGDIETRAVINCAGIQSDDLNNMVSDHKLKIHARRGEYYLLDKKEKDFVKHTIFQAPTKAGKGVLIAPTVSDNIIIGPNANEVDKDDVTTTRAGLDEVGLKAGLSAKNVPLRSTITTFAGLRASSENGDFTIGEVSDAPYFFNCVGIESPGLTSAPAIAIDVADDVAEKLSANVNLSFDPIRPRPIIMMELSDEEKDKVIKENPAYGRMVCRCEFITEGEIVAAMHREPAATTLDGIKRRTRAGSGRCQAGFCMTRQIELLQKEHLVSPFSISKFGKNSTFLVAKNKDGFEEGRK